MSEHEQSKIIEVSKVSTVKPDSGPTYVYTMQKQDSMFVTLGKLVIRFIQYILGAVVFACFLTLAFTYGSVLQAVPVYLALKFFSGHPEKSISEQTKIWVDRGQINFQVRQSLCDASAKELKIAVARKSLGDLKVKLKAKNIKYENDTFLDENINDDSLLVAFIKQVSPTEEVKETEDKNTVCRQTYTYPVAQYEQVIDRTCESIAAQVKTSKTIPEL